MPATYTIGDGYTYDWNQDAVDAIPSNLAGQGLQTVETYAKAPNDAYVENVDVKTGFTAMTGVNYIYMIAMLHHGGLSQAAGGTGIRITAANTGIAYTILMTSYTRINGYEVTFGTTAAVTPVCIDARVPYTRVFNCIVHDVNATASNSAVGIMAGSGGYVYNNFVYQVSVNIAASYSAFGVRVLVATASTYVNNNTVINIKGLAGSGNNAFGIHSIDSANLEVKNNYAGDVSAPAVGDDYELMGVAADSRNNISEDNTADDAGGTGHQIGRIPANQFVNIVVGAENLHLKLGSNCINNGTDLSGSGVVDDIDGTARPVYGQYDVGADEFDGLVPTISGSETIDDNNENIMIEPVPRPIEGFLALDISAIIVNLDDFDIIISAWGPLGDRVIGHYNVTSDGVDITIAENGHPGVVTEDRKIGLNHVSIFQSEGIHIQRIRNSAVDRNVPMDYYFTTKQMAA